MRQWASISLYWIWLGITGCVVQSGLFAGLNLAIFSLSRLRLQLEADGGNSDAVRVLEPRKNSSQVLMTVICGNVATNVLLSRPDIVHTSVYLPVHEALREAAFKERGKIHDIIMEGTGLALRKRRYPAMGN